MSKPHKHKDLIIAWANGHEIQIFSRPNDKWVDCYPSWCLNSEYRIRPDTIKAYTAPVKSVKEDPYKELKEAYKSGKQIEYKYSYGWDSASCLLFVQNVDPIALLKNHPPEKYRIKEEVKRKLVPFTWEDREQLRGKWVRNKKSSSEFVLQFLNENGSAWTWQYMLDHFEFIDGSPVGKYIEDTDYIKNDE